MPVQRVSARAIERHDTKFGRAYAHFLREEADYLLQIFGEHSDVAALKTRKAHVAEKIQLLLGMAANDPSLPIAIMARGSGMSYGTAWRVLASHGAAAPRKRGRPPKNGPQ
jgi:hypothetical protein